MSNRFNQALNYFTQGRIPVILVWSCLLLESVGTMVEIPVALMALLGIGLVVKRGKKLIWQGGGRLFSIFFLLVWVPGLISLPLAFSPAKAVIGILIIPRFYFAGLFIIATFDTPGRHQQLLRLASWVLLFWVGDALVQSVFGINLLGYHSPPSHVNGVFGERHIYLGSYLAVFSPLLLLYAQRKWSVWAQSLIFGAVWIVILLAGSRAGWIIFSVVLVAYFAFLLKENRQFAMRAAIGVMVVLVFGIIIGYHFSSGFDARLRLTMSVFNGGERTVNAAMTDRIPIWMATVKMIADHPWTGVGVRCFPYVYPQYAAPDDRFVNHGEGTGATHAHQLLLEVAAVSGMVGLVGLLGVFFMLITSWRQAEKDRRQWMLPYGLALCGILFPFNSTFAFYSSAWSQVFFWFVSLYLASSQHSLSMIEST